MGPNVTLKILHNEGNYKQGEKKKILRMGENNSEWKTWQRTSLQNIRETHEAQDEKNKQPNPKAVKRRKFLQSRHTGGQ